MNTENPKWIACEEWVLIGSDGVRHKTAVRIGEPYKVPDGAWACPVDLGHPMGRVEDIAGKSSMQALSLAAKIVGLNASTLEGRGYVIEGFGKEEILKMGYLDAVFVMPGVWMQSTGKSRGSKKP